MFLRCILLLLALPPFAEMCVPTSTPDGMIMTSTSDNLPMTTEDPDDDTTPAEEMSTTAGGGGATVASTTAQNMCADCDVNEIAPGTVSAGGAFNTAELDPVDGCKRTYAICQREDDMICQDIFMYAVSPTGTFSITDETTNTFAGVTLSCNEDGTYSWNDVKEISAISCSFGSCM